MLYTKPCNTMYMCLVFRQYFGYIKMMVVQAVLYYTARRHNGFLRRHKQLITLRAVIV